MDRLVGRASWPPEFRPALGADCVRRACGARCSRPERPTRPRVRRPPISPTAWYGYVSKDLRDILNPAGRRRSAAAPCAAGSGSGGRIRTAAGCACCTRSKAKTKTAAQAKAPDEVPSRKPKKKAKPPGPCAVATRACTAGNGVAAGVVRGRAAGVHWPTRSAVSHADLYGQSGDCKSDAQASCLRQEIAGTVASAISIPPFAFQNRPTFPAGHRADGRHARALRRGSVPGRPFPPDRREPAQRDQVPDHRETDREEDCS